MIVKEREVFMMMGGDKTSCLTNQDIFSVKNKAVSIFGIASRLIKSVFFCTAQNKPSFLQGSLGVAILCCLTMFSSCFSLQAQESGTLLMDLDRRISGLEETIQELTGKVEELQHALKMARQGTLPSATEPSSLPSGSEVALPQDPTNSKVAMPDNIPFAKARGADSGDVSSEPLSDHEGKNALKPETEQEAYDKARRLLNQGNYEESEAAFKSFISSFEKSPLVVNAQYWLGETYYLRQDYQRSSVAFMDAYKTYRTQMKDGGKANSFAKAPESLIKLVSSLKGLGKTQNACVTYKQLRKEFPKLPSNLERLTQKSIEGLPCQ